MIVVSREQARRLDQLTIERYGVSGYTLMTRAGTGAARMLLESFPHVRGKRVLVLAGKGNNGGDGFIVAHLLRKQRVKVEVLLLGRCDDVRGDAVRALNAYRRGRGSLTEVDPRDAVKVVRTRLAEAALVVDAIFGTGLNAPLTGPLRELVELVNSSGIPVFAVDIPSGLDADSGAPLGAAIQAEATATFGFPKLGQMLLPGASYVGRLGIIDIGLAPEAVAEVAPGSRLLNAATVAPLVPRRSVEAHKGTAGHVLLLAGSAGHTGAARLAAHACCRSGAGLTTLAGPASLHSIFAAGNPEVMTARLPDVDGFVRFEQRQVLELIERKDAIVIGPGLGTHSAARRLVRFVVERSTASIVLDADALSCIAADPAILRKAKQPPILTPHPGEMARLLGVDVPAVQEARVETARRFATLHRCVLILKGARTVVAEPDGRFWINLSGNPGMASGGMGDALSGMIGALAGQGLAAGEAACLAVFLHGEIGDFLASERGPLGLLATDIIEGIPAGIQRLLKSMLDESAESERLERASGKSRRN